MPSLSGVDPPFGIRLSANFFRCVDREWIPRTIDDPDFPHLVYSAGKEYGWGLRELCVVRLLFESGARISEILGLTAQDLELEHAELLPVRETLWVSRLFPRYYPGGPVHVHPDPPSASPSVYDA